MCHGYLDDFSLALHRRRGDGSGVPSGVQNAFGPRGDPGRWDGGRSVSEVCGVSGMVFHRAACPRG